MSEVDWKTEALNPKWWLIILALGHTFMGTLLPMDPDNDNELMAVGVEATNSFLLVCSQVGHPTLDPGVHILPIFQILYGPYDPYITHITNIIWTVRSI